MSNKQFSKGQTIYKQGDTLSHAFVIMSGTVEVGGEEKGQGDIVGDVWLIKDTAAQDKAVAKTDVELKPLALAEIEKLAYSAPPEIQKILVNLSAAPSGAGANSAAAPAAAPAGDSMGYINAMDKFTKLLEERCSRMEQYVPASLRGLEDRDLVAEVERRIKEGPLKPLLEDDTLNDILINKYNEIYVERNGLLEKTGVEFKNDDEVKKLAGDIAFAMGRQFNEERPILDARLSDGSRVNVIAPPLAVDATTVSIRKFSKKRITLEVMKGQENVSDSLGEFLKVVGRCRINVVISGGTGSGKTTLLNALSNTIDPKERIVTIEDAAELQLQQPHVVRLETRPFNPIRGKFEEVSMRDLVKNALRMRPDRIIVGEVRGGEAFDMMQAMNTGHEGSLTTVHANHPRDALNRIENMVTMANMNIPVRSIRQQIAAALHLIVQVSRMRDGHRRITYVSEVVGMEGDVITMQDLFVYVVNGEDEAGRIQGSFKWTGIMPKFTRRVSYYGEQERLMKALGLKSLNV